MPPSDSLTEAEERSRRALLNLRDIVELLIEASVVQGGLERLELIISYALTIMLDTIYEHPEALPVWVEAIRADPAGPLHHPTDEEFSAMGVEPSEVATPEFAKREVVSMLIRGLVPIGGDDVER